MVERCVTCRYWDTRPGTSLLSLRGLVGVCEKRPPGDGVGVLRSDEGWCDKWKERVRGD